jgi:fumagillin biosynthesis methyltransferase
MHWPDFLAKTNYRKPLDDKNCCYIDAYPEKKSFFQRCTANPAHQESFSSFMDLWAKHKRPWPQFYDTKALLEHADLSDGSAFVVDVGGHHGIDLLRVLEKHPGLPAGSLVLEDLPDVVASVNLTTDKIQAVEYDFLEQNAVQPIKGKLFCRSTRSKFTFNELTSNKL